MKNNNFKERRVNRETHLQKMRKGLCLVALGCALCTGSYAQKQTTSQNSTPRNFTGQVFDSKDGSSLIGCTVRVKGKQTATITDVNGNYSITAKPGDILIISWVSSFLVGIRI